MEPLSLLSFTRPDPARDETLVGQIYADLRAAITGGSIPAATKLPSSRRAAQVLGVSRNTLNTAYDLLRAEGLIEISAQRRPLVLAPSPLAASRLASAAPMEAPNRSHQTEIDAAWSHNYREHLFIDRNGAMSPGRPDPALFPHDAWARALRRATRRPFKIGPTHALPALCLELAQILSRDRGMRVEPAQIIITSGTQASLALAALVLARAGDKVLMEDPGYMGARAAMLGADLVSQAMPVDEEGALVPPLPDTDPARLIYLCPSNQYPSGHRLSLARRMGFIDYARQTGAILLEDDYDSEFQWRGREIAAMHALAPDGEVIYLGTASKSLSTAIHLGWMVVPPKLVQPLAQAQVNLGLCVNIQVQAAFSDWLASGEHRAHLRKISRIYAKRGGMLADQLKRRFGDKIALHRPDGGLQLTLVFKAGQDEQTALIALHKAGFSPARLSALCIEAQMTGLVIGFADATEERINRFCDILAGL